jgi:hypothetical protein
MIDALYAGQTGLSLEQLSDRMAVINLTSAYAHFAQTGDLEPWKVLFAANARFSISTTPGSPPKEISMKEVFEVESRGFTDARHVHKNPFSGEKRLYQFGPLLFQAQTSDQIEIVSNVFSIRVHPDTPTPRIEWTALYEASFSKEASQWKIANWKILMDQRIEVLASAPKELVSRDV